MPSSQLGGPEVCRPPFQAPISTGPRLLSPRVSIAHAISTHPSRILILYGSLRARSFSRLSAEEAGRILSAFGAEVRFFHPSYGLRLIDSAR